MSFKICNSRVMDMRCFYLLKCIHLSFCLVMSWKVIYHYFNLLRSDSDGCVSCRKPIIGLQFGQMIQNVYPFCLRTYSTLENLSDVLIKNCTLCVCGVNCCVLVVQVTWGLVDAKMWAERSVQRTVHKTTNEAKYRYQREHVLYCTMRPWCNNLSA